MFRHQHRYRETGRRFVLVNTNRLPSFGDLHDSDLKAMALFGFTSIMLRCIKCGDVRSAMIFGNMESASRYDDEIQS